MKKRIFIIIVAVIIAFAAYNVLWFAWSHVKYDKFSAGMEKTDFSSFITPRYIYTGADGCNYHVKYPDYLSFTGNMSVGSPHTEEGLLTDVLIIWPKVKGGYDFGVLLYENNGEFPIYIDSEGNALAKEDEEIVYVTVTTSETCLE